MESRAEIISDVVSRLARAKDAKDLCKIIATSGVQEAIEKLDSGKGLVCITSGRLPINLIQFQNTSGAYVLDNESMKRAQNAKYASITPPSSAPGGRQFYSK